MSGSVTLYKQDVSFLEGSGFCQIYVDTTGGHATWTDLIDSRGDGYMLYSLTQGPDGTWTFGVDKHLHHCCVAGQKTGDPVGTYTLDGTGGSGCCEGEESEGVTGSIS
jgi:hypothetical protein